MGDQLSHAPNDFENDVFRDRRTINNRMVREGGRGEIINH
jgi:hypothetical protein